MYQGLEYEANQWDLGFDLYEVDVILVCNQDPNVGPDVQRYAENLFFHKMRNK